MSGLAVEVCLAVSVSGICRAGMELESQDASGRCYHAEVGLNLLVERPSIIHPPLKKLPGCSRCVCGPAAAKFCSSHASKCVSIGTRPVAASLGWGCSRGPACGRACCTPGVRAVHWQLYAYRLYADTSRWLSSDCVPKVRVCVAEQSRICRPQATQSFDVSVGGFGQ